MLAEKTRGNLSLDEQRLIENSLTELRFRFVQASESAAKASSEEKSHGARMSTPAHSHHRARLGHQFGRSHHRLHLRSMHVDRSARQASAAFDPVAV